jgi:hypothetical protein
MTSVTSQDGDARGHTTFTRPFLLVLVGVANMQSLVLHFDKRAAVDHVIAPWSRKLIDLKYRNIAHPLTVDCFNAVSALHFIYCVDAQPCT